MVSKEDRDDYEEGLRDRARGSIDQAVTDLSGNHTDSEAYYKGRTKKTTTDGRGGR